MTALDRLDGYYNVLAWEPTDNPGGFDDNGHRANFVQYLRDVGEVAVLPATLLLHADGVDGSTTITDVYGHTVTASGDAQLDTGQKKFGTSSIQYSGGGLVTVSNHAEFSLSGDFTVDFQLYSTNSSQHNVFSLGSDGNVVYTKATGRELSFWVSGDVIVGSAVSLNAWHHIALTRNSGVIRLYLDGIYQGQFSTAVTFTGPFYIGAQSGLGLGLTGWMDEVRVINGTALWGTNSNFTPPSAPGPGGPSSERLSSYYNGSDYHAVYNPGGLGNGGHRTNFVPALQDVATAATNLGLSSAAITRLASYYSGARYNAISNPGGMGRGGHRINFEPALFDLVPVGQAIADEVKGTVRGVGTATAHATATGAGFAAGAYYTMGTALAQGTAAATGRIVTSAAGTAMATGRAEHITASVLFLTDGSSNLLLVNGVDILLLEVT